MAEQENFLPEESQDPEEKEKPVTFQELAKGTIRDFSPGQKRYECDLFSGPKVVLKKVLK